MRDSIRTRLERLADRYEEVGRMLATPEVAGDGEKFREASMEYARLEPVALAWRDFRSLEKQAADAQAMGEDADPEMRELAALERKELESQL